MTHVFSLRCSFSVPLFSVLCFSLYFLFLCHDVPFPLNAKSPMDAFGLYYGA